jgi:hypothetical protein
MMTGEGKREEAEMCTKCFARPRINESGRDARASSAAQSVRVSLGQTSAGVPAMVFLVRFHNFIRRYLAFTSFFV